MRETLGLDLLNPQHHLQVLSSLTDRLSFVFLLVEDQAKELGLDVDQFEQRLYGKGVAARASIAFLTELESFFRRLDQIALARLTAKSIEVMKAGQKRADEMLSSGELDSLLEKATREMETLTLASGGNG